MGAQRHGPSDRISYDPTLVYDPLSRRRRSPTKPLTLPSRFPDEDHSYQPQRRLHIAKLQQNALPPPSPSLASSRTPRKTRQRIANIADSKLWGFSIKYSPTKELSEKWEQAKCKQSSEVKRVLAEERDQQQRQQQEQAHTALVRQDYSLYLYLAGKYGALDAILYCCTPFPGRLYALVIDQSVRKLQRWRRERLLALRRYWIVRLSRDVVEGSIHLGLAQLQLALEQQAKAAVFLNRLRWRYAASAFRSWFEFTQRQIEVRWRFQFCVQENLRRRLIQWRDRIVHMKEFKKQLKQVARRKQMHAAMEQWLEWKSRQQKLRIHLQQQWTKLERQCFSAWQELCQTVKRERRAAIRIQSQWRVFAQRRHYRKLRLAATTIARVVRGFLARRYVARRRVQVEVAATLGSILSALEWDAISQVVAQKRTLAVEAELIRVARQAQFVREAVTGAISLVQYELSKARKNAMHHRLERILEQLQNDGSNGDGRGPRTQEVLIREATQLVLEEVAATTRATAVAKFLSHDINRPVTVDHLCVVCTANAIALVEYSQPWLPRSLPCSHHTLLVDSVQHDDLRQWYTEILDELLLRDAAIYEWLISRPSQPSYKA